MSNQTEPRSWDLVAEIDRARLSPLQLLVLLLCFLVAAFDGMDAQIIGFAAPAMLPDLGFRNDQLGLIFSAATAGMAVGALVLGLAGDRFGRKRIMVASVVLFATCTFATTLVRDFEYLMAIRFVTGIGMGGALPNAVTLVSEYAPARQRRLMISVMYIGFSAGGIVGGWAATVLIEAHGWRSIFYFGGVLPLLLGLLLIGLQPESLNYLAKRAASAGGQIARTMNRIAGSQIYTAADNYTLADIRVDTHLGNLFAEGRARNTFMLWIAFFINLLVLFFLMYWTPKLLVEHGFAFQDAVRVLIIFNVGGVLGALVLAWMSNRFDPKWMLCGYFVAASLFTIAVGLSLDHGRVMLVFAFCMGITAGGAQVGLYPLVTQVYPTAIRVTGVGWAQAWGRTGSIIGPLLGGALIGAGLDFEGSYVTFGIPLLIAATAIGCMNYRESTPPKSSATHPGIKESYQVSRSPTPVSRSES